MERPILFSGPMVHAILAGRKTQTRRTMKPTTSQDDMAHIIRTPGLLAALIRLRCPYGQPGDRLWVRETHQFDAPRDGTWPDTEFYGCKGASLDLIPKRFRYPAHCLYAASWAGSPITWRPSIFMPRWASRINLEITGVWVERLQDISADDATAEGLSCLSKDGGRLFKYGIPDRDGEPGEDDQGWHWHRWRQSPIDAYQALWDSINAKRAPWSSNPWAWVMEFKRV